MSLWIKRANAEVDRSVRLIESINRILPVPFEDRRSKVGMITYGTWRWLRFTPVVLVPFLTFCAIAEARDHPHENVLTALHLWLADHGMFRHDTVKALNPTFEDERVAMEWKLNDRKWRLTGADLLSDRELREFAAINIEKQRTIESLKKST